MLKSQKTRAFSLSEILVALGIIGVLCVTMLSLNSMSDNNYKVATTKLAQVDSALKSWGKAISKTNETGLGARQTIRSQGDLVESLSSYMNNHGMSAHEGEITVGDDTNAQSYSGFQDILLDNGTSLSVRYSAELGSGTYIDGSREIDADEFDSPIATIIASVPVKGHNETSRNTYALLGSGELMDFDSLHDGWDTFTRKTDSEQEITEKDPDTGEDITIKIYQFCNTDQSVCFTSDHPSDTIRVKVNSAGVCPGTNQTGSILSMTLGTFNGDVPYEISQCCDSPLYYNPQSTQEDKCECNEERMRHDQKFGKGEVFVNDKEKGCVTKVKAGAYAVNGTQVLCDSKDENNSPKGYYCPDDGMDSPKLCDKGFYCPNDKSETPPDGQEYNADKYVTDTNGKITDILDGGLIAQIPCPAGYYCPTKGMTEGTTNVCPKGSYCPEGSETPITCPDGKTTLNENNVVITGAVNVDQCKLCPDGTQEVNKECRSCESNQFTNAKGQCEFCHAGTYLDKENKVCKKCPKGYYCPNEGMVDSDIIGSTTYLCKMDNAGGDGSYYQDEEGQQGCKKCPTNSNIRYNDDGLPIDKNGNVIVPNRIDFCLCDGGWYTDENGSPLTKTTSCKEAGDTHYSPDYDNKRYDCRANSHTYMKNKTASDSRECICDDGYYFDKNEKTYDKQCKNDICGVYSTIKEVNTRVQISQPISWNKDNPYIDCDDNPNDYVYYYTKNGKTGTGKDSCELLPDGHIINTDKCGTTECTSVDPHSEPSDDKKSCVCSAGYFMKDGKCEACPCGTYKEGKGNDESDCKACPNENQYAPAGSTMQDACTTPSDGYIRSEDKCEQVQCDTSKHTVAGDDGLSCVCAPGYYLKDGKCEACPCGTYKETKGNDKTACQACPNENQYAPAGSTTQNACKTPDEGYVRSGDKCEQVQCRTNSNSVPSDDKLSCVCAPGYYLKDGVCTGCPCGTYKEAKGNGDINSCVKCSNGSYYSGTAGNSSSVCQAIEKPQDLGEWYKGADENGNEIANGEGACGLIEYCEVGRYRDPETKTCQPCPCGTYQGLTMNTGDETSCQKCNAEGVTYPNFEYYLPITPMYDGEGNPKLDKDGNPMSGTAMSASECIKLTQEGYHVTENQCDIEPSCPHYDEFYVIRYKGIEKDAKVTLYQQMIGAGSSGLKLRVKSNKGKWYWKKQKGTNGVDDGVRTMSTGMKEAAEKLSDTDKSRNFQKYIAYIVGVRGENAEVLGAFTPYTWYVKFTRETAYDPDANQAEGGDGAILDGEDEAQDSVNLEGTLLRSMSKADYEKDILYRFTKCTYTGRTTTDNITEEDCNAKTNATFTNQHKGICEYKKNNKKTTKNNVTESWCKDKSKDNKQAAGTFTDQNKGSCSHIGTLTSKDAATCLNIANGNVAEATFVSYDTVSQTGVQDKQGFVDKKNSLYQFSKCTYQVKETSSMSKTNCNKKGTNKISYNERWVWTNYSKGRGYTATECTYWKGTSSTDAATCDNINASIQNNPSKSNYRKISYLPKCKSEAAIKAIKGDDYLSVNEWDYKSDVYGCRVPKRGGYLKAEWYLTSTTAAMDCTELCKLSSLQDDGLCVPSCDNIRVQENIYTDCTDSTDGTDKTGTTAEGRKELCVGGSVQLENGSTCDAIPVTETFRRYASPLVLDLLGNGLKFTSAEDGVFFDLNADGYVEKTAWTAKQTEFDDAFLIYDKNGNGKVDNGKELFGDQNGEKNGFIELAKYDDNKDNVINKDDPIYFKLRLWADMNSNAKVDKGEIKTLEEANVVEIPLDYTEEVDKKGNILTDIWGNITGIAGSFKMMIQNAAGKLVEVVRKMIDVFFVTQ